MSLANLLSIVESEFALSTPVIEPLCEFSLPSLPLPLSVPSTISSNSSDFDSLIQPSFGGEATTAPSPSSTLSSSPSSPRDESEETDEESSSSEPKIKSRSESHLASEKRRRANINDGFVMLRTVVPGCQPCHSKAEILKKAVHHIKHLSSSSSATKKVSTEDCQNGEQQKQQQQQPNSELEIDDKSVINKEQSKVNFLNKFAEKIAKQRDQAQKELEVHRQLVNMFVDVLGSSPLLCNSPEVQQCLSFALTQLQQQPSLVSTPTTMQSTKPLTKSVTLNQTSISQSGALPTLRFHYQVQPKKDDKILAITPTPSISSTPSSSINPTTLMALKRKLGNGEVAALNTNSKKVKISDGCVASSI